MENIEPIHIVVPRSPADPRDLHYAPDGIIVHRSPTLGPEDITVVDGIPVTSVARTLIDLAECMDAHELRECFRRALGLRLLDIDELAAARARVEWRPSLAMFDEVAAEFAGS